MPRLLLLFLAAVIAFAEPVAYDVRVFIGPGKEITLTFPAVRKADLVGFAASFVMTEQDHPVTRDKFAALLSASPQLTLVLTTKP